MDVPVTLASFGLILFIPALLDACGHCCGFHKALSTKYRAADQIIVSTSECILSLCLAKVFVCCFFFQC